MGTRPRTHSTSCFINSLETETNGSTGSWKQLHCYCRTRAIPSSPEMKIWLLVLLKEMTQTSVSFGYLLCRKSMINAGDVFEGLNGYVASHLLTECIVFNWLWSQQKRQPHLIYWTVKGRLLQILGKHQLVLDSSKYNDVLTKGTFIKEDLIAYLTLGTGCLNGKWKYAKRFLFFRGRSKGNRRIKLRIEKPFLLPPFHYG